MILVYLENNGEKLPKAALCAIGAALQAKQLYERKKAVGLLLGGSGTKLAAEQAASYGLDEVVYVEAEAFEQYLTLNYAAAFIAAQKELNAEMILAISSSRGKDLMPRVAQNLNAGQASDVLELLPNFVFKRPMYAGNIIAEVEITTPVKILTLRQSAFEPAAKTSSASSVRALNIAAAVSPGQAFVSYDTLKSERPELTDASVVVSGGRALKSAENFETLLAPLADILGGALGASRAAVDSGYAPNDWQVGQTGKVVAPQLYIAVGISGAIQHLAGMKDSKVIVAINKDADAPIFEIADYGLVGDLYQIIPELIAELKKAKS